MQRERGGINFNIIFYLAQNIQNIIISTLVNKKNDNDIFYILCLY